MEHGKHELRQMQSLPLEYKIIMSKERIRTWYESWMRFDIRNDKTGKERFEVMDVREGPTVSPKLRENEDITAAHNGQVYVAFSGGIDSTVLLHMVREMYPDVVGVFSNTGLEYPEIQKFVKTFDNVKIIRPKMRFDEVVTRYGYPIASKRVADYVYTAKRNPDSMRGKWLRGEEKTKFVSSKWSELVNADFNVSARCCDVMKKAPMHEFQKNAGKKPIIATMAEESLQRQEAWRKNGCNAFDGSDPKSTPMSFWTKQDVLEYIKRYELPIASVYGDVVYEEDPEQMRFEECGIDCAGHEKLVTTGCDRTGCIFCGFGCHLEKGESRFERLKKTHPRQYDYCMNGGEYDKDGIWKPNKEGLGMRHVFDELNKIYGEGFIRY